MTTQQRLHAYEVLLRMARVRELKAASELSEAVYEEHNCQQRVDEVVATRDAIAKATDTCVIRDASLDVARYEMLKLLDAGFASRQNIVTGELTDAVKVSEQRAADNVLAKRYRENVTGQLERLSLGVYLNNAAKNQEESVELWLANREEPYD